MPKIDLAAAPVRTGTIYPAEHAAAVAGRSSLRLGEAGGLTQFGVNLVTLAPGAASSLRHWHMAEDEFALVLEGRPTLVEDDGETPLAPGDAMAWPAGAANGHRIVNRAEAPARVLVVGSKAARERCVYADVDLVYEFENGAHRFTRRDGSALG